MGFKNPKLKIKNEEVKIMELHMKIKERVKEGKPAGLYRLIGGKKNGELTSEKIEKFLTKNILDLRTRKRASEWKKELEFWEEYGRIYYHLEDAKPYYDLARSIEEFIEPRAKDIWLDAGCGPAKMSQIVWKKSKGKVKKIIGIDIVLKPARETLAKMSENIPFELRYANLGERLPFSDNFFDGIVANICLSYVIDFEGKKGKEALEAVLREMYRILKPGGHMVWSTPKHNVHFQWNFIHSIPDMLNIKKQISHGVIGLSVGMRILKHALEIQKKGKKGIYTFLSKDELEKLLFKIGFVNPSWQKTFTRQVWVNRIYKPWTLLSP